jgi:hypothetical protein
MGALATPGGREREKRKLLDDGDKPDWLKPYQGAIQDERM